MSVKYFFACGGISSIALSSNYQSPFFKSSATSFSTLSPLEKSDSRLSKIHSIPSLSRGQVNNDASSAISGCDDCQEERVHGVKPMTLHLEKFRCNPRLQPGVARNRENAAVKRRNN